MFGEKSHKLKNNSSFTWITSIYLSKNVSVFSICYSFSFLRIEAYSFRSIYYAYLLVLYVNIDKDVPCSTFLVIELYIFSIKPLFFIHGNIHRSIKGFKEAAWVCNEQNFERAYVIFWDYAVWTNPQPSRLWRWHLWLNFASACEIVAYTIFQSTWVSQNARTQLCQILISAKIDQSAK